MAPTTKQAKAAAKAVVKGSSVRSPSILRPILAPGSGQNSPSHNILTDWEIASQVPQGPHFDHLPPPQDSSAVSVAQVPPCLHPRQPQLDAQKIILYPLNTESAMKKIEENNTLVFIVDVKANKRQIKGAIKKLYDVDTVKVNTLVRPDGSKKAFARLTPDVDALDIAATKLAIV
ncbi:60S ribosomal protein L23 [Penicillium atrosanguineum]|nr:60S ribosomal protein L23 [Penicillium atrosanguineum]